MDGADVQAAEYISSQIVPPSVVYIAAYRQPELARYPNAEGELMKGVGLFWGFNGSYQAREVAIVWGRRHIVLFRKLRREMKI